MSCYVSLYQGPSALASSGYFPVGLPVCAVRCSGADRENITNDSDQVQLLGTVQFFCGTGKTKGTLGVPSDSLSGGRPEERIGRLRHGVATTTTHNPIATHVLAMRVTRDGIEAVTLRALSGMRHFSSDQEEREIALWTREVWCDVLAEYFWSVTNHEPSGSVHAIGVP